MGENSYIEFKEEEIKAKELAEEIVAFSNSEGGMILIGVDDEGNIKGVKDDKIEETVMNICRNNCIPHIIPLYENIEVEGKRGLRLLLSLRGLISHIILLTINIIYGWAPQRGLHQRRNCCGFLRQEEASILIFLSR